MESFLINMASQSKDPTNRLFGYVGHVGNIMRKIISEEQIKDLDTYITQVIAYLQRFIQHHRFTNIECPDWKAAAESYRKLDSLWYKISEDPPHSELSFEDWEALYNAMSTFETIVLSNQDIPPSWEDIIKDGFIALARLEIPKIPNPLETINEESLINTTQAIVQSLANSTLIIQGNDTVTEIKGPITLT